MASRKNLLSDEQIEVFGKIKDWLNDSDKKVFSLAGAAFTGKRMVLSAVGQELVQKKKRPLLIAPSVCIAKRYNGVCGKSWNPMDIPLEVGHLIRWKWDTNPIDVGHQSDRSGTLIRLIWDTNPIDLGHFMCGGFVGLLWCMRVHQALIFDLLVGVTFFALSNPNCEESCQPNACR